MDDWEIHFREKSRRRARRLGLFYDLETIGILLLAAVAMIVALAVVLH